MPRPIKVKLGIDIDNPRCLGVDVEPRRSAGKKWTALPKDYVTQVIDALRQSFADEVKSGKFIVEGRIYADELLVRVGFLETGRLRQTNFEMSLDYKPGKDDTFKLLNLAMLEELFSSTSDADFPRTWQIFEVEGRRLYLQFSSNNSDLDTQADALLGEDETNLVGGVGDEEPVTAEQLKANLGIDDSDDDFSDDDDGSKTH